MKNLSINYVGLTLKNPIIVGSSGLTNSAKKNKALEDAGCGAIVLNSLFEEQILMKSHTVINKFDYSNTNSLIGNFLKNNEVKEYLNLIKESKNQCSIPIIASINCFTYSDWIEYANLIEENGANALEINFMNILSNPNENPLDSINNYLNIIRDIRKWINIPIIVKISKSFSNIPWLVNQFKNSGANAVVLFNRFHQPDINIHTLKVESAPIFSKRDALSDTLRWIGLTSSSIKNFDLAASSGVDSWEDVVKCLLAGANAVQIVSSIYLNKKQFIGEIIEQMSAWMVTNNFEKIDDFRGMLNADSISDATTYERAQFMKYFSNHGKNAKD